MPAAQRIVIVYDDFRADTRREYLHALALLGLSDDGRTDFASVNPSQALHWTGLRDFQARLSRRMPLLYRPARALAHAAGLRLFVVLEKLNRHTAPRKPLRPEFERELVADFLPQVEKVEPGLLDRDLAAWKRPALGNRSPSRPALTWPRCRIGRPTQR